MIRPRWVWASVLLGLIGLGAGLVGWKWRQDRWLTKQLAQARDAMSRGHYAVARGTLASLLASRPSWDEALYELGVCEQARGRIQEATDVWARVPQGSPMRGWIEVRLSKLEMGAGRFDACERLLRSAADRPGAHRAEARWGLVLLLRLQGRFEEARRWLEQGFEIMTDPVETLQRLYRLDHDPYPIEGVRRALDQAGDQAPDDDRVWLGRAHLATIQGRFEEAKTWLDRCRDRRPEDPVVWRKRWEWALAAGRPDVARETLAHLPAEQEPRSRAASLRAWFAARRGDRGGERQALSDWIERDAAEPRALDRLAELDLEEKRNAEASDLRKRRNELDLVRKEYERGLFSSEPRTKASELAALADRLGRRFDAERWNRLGSPGGGNPKRSVVVAETHEDSLRGKTLADLLPDLGRVEVTAPGLSTQGSQPALRFTDDSAERGLRFTQINGVQAGKLIPPVTSSGGVGLIDYDGDGWLDVFAVQGGDFPHRPDDPHGGDRLFRNRGNATFEDVTERSGIAAMPRGYGHGVTVADYDNDGHPDLFVTRWRSYALYRNRGDGTFEDATARAGLDGDRDWPTSAAFADLDGDGDLDLYVCHYLKWDENDDRTCADPNDPTIYNCSPIDFESLPDHVFRNDGGRFVDVSKEAGLHDSNGRGLGVLAADLDGDGRIDLFVANDMSANYLFRGIPGFRLEEKGLESGVAGNASGGSQAGMGVACGDLDGDGRPDLAVTNFYNESTTFFRNLGQGFFADETDSIGLAAPSRYRLGFGVSFLDADNDGWLDLITANGHVFDGRPQFPWKMPAQLLRNGGGRSPRLSDVSASSGEPFQVPRMGRGLAVGDLDNDGRMDVLVVSQGEPLAFLHNRSTGGHFLTIQLVGTTSNRDAVGARVTVHCEGRALEGWRIGGGSYQSSSDPRLHFGLGKAQAVEAMEVRWPSGRVDRCENLRADGGYLLRESDPRAQPMPGFGPASR
ncbi:FG-GAP-like repeat-containing protein [Aquisphaera insulae]|uniref:FG-GAP-like repeat-containing protein n=1 Tax=Aquisphaera insulae TaxID=2712864 RepID=UPI0013EE23A7|nr:FG-GAP-like repeat-containing protein [Aquisphaera insulae]